MKTRIFTLIVSLFIATMAFAYDVQIDGIYYNLDNENKTAYVTCKNLNYNSYSGSIIIPETITYNNNIYYITSIGYSAFEDCSSLTSINIPNSVTSIGGYAFYNCSSLTSIEISNSVTSIGSYAFYNCSSLNEIRINIDDLEEYINSGINKFCSDNVRSSATRKLYKNGIEVTELIIPETITIIPDYTFYNCSDLTSITTHNNVTSIGKYAFENCSSLNEIRFNIDDLVGYINSGINQLLIRLDVNRKLYKDDIEVTELIIPETITIIPNYTFYNCSDLTSVTIPNSVTSIGESAFYDCSSLTSIEIPNNVTYIGPNAFNNCTSLSSVIWNAKQCETDFSDDNGQYYDYIAPFNCTASKSVIIGDSVEYIPNRLFMNANVDSLTFACRSSSCNVKSCGEKSFYNCPLSSVNIIIESIEDFCKNGDNALLRKSRNAHLILNRSEIVDLIIPEGIIKFPIIGSLSSIKSISIPSTITEDEIRMVGFGGLSSLKHIHWNIISCEYGAKNYAPFYSINHQIETFTFGDSVKWIPNFLCYGMSNLSSIKIPNSVTWIGATFKNCTGLRTIEIGSSVNGINGGAFENCTGIYSIKIDAVIPPILEYASTFNKVSRTAQIKVPCGSVDVYQASSYWNEFTNYIESPNTLTVNVNDANMGVAVITKQATCTDIVAQVQAQAKPGYKFVGWSDGFTENPHTVFVTEDMTITAEFIAEAPKYTITLNCDESKGSVSGAGTYESSTEATIEAIANKNYHFVQWSDGNTENPRTITVTEDINLTAEFAIDQYQVTLESNGNGSVTGSGTYDYGTEITIEAIADKGYHFEKWSDGNIENPRTITVTENITLSAEFAIDQYQVTLESNGNGIVTGSGTYYYGTEITIEATANENYHFVRWSDGNTENPRIIIVTEDMNLTAEFAIDQYQVTLKSNGNGSATGSGTYEYGTEITIEAIADKGYHFEKWSDGNIENPRTITVTENIELSATFELDETPVENVQITSANVYSRDGRLHVEGAETNYYVLDMAGRLIYSGRDTELQLPRGVYVVNVGGEVQKVVL